MSRHRTVNLAQAARYLRLRNGREPHRALLLYHVRAGHLKPDSVTTAHGQELRRFTPATLRAFARLVGWRYLPRAVVGARVASSPADTGAR